MFTNKSFIAFLVNIYLVYWFFYERGKYIQGIALHILFYKFFMKHPEFLHRRRTKFTMKEK